jgi:hypothetical protein
MLTTALEILGIAAISGFAWFVWPPLVLLVIGVALILSSRAANR